MIPGQNKFFSSITTHQRCFLLPFCNSLVKLTAPHTQPPRKIIDPTALDRSHFTGCWQRLPFHAYYFRLQKADANAHMQARVRRSTKKRIKENKPEKLSHNVRLVDFFATFCATENKASTWSTCATNKLV